MKHRWVYSNPVREGFRFKNCEVRNAKPLYLLGKVFFLVSVSQRLIIKHQLVSVLN